MTYKEQLIKLSNIVVADAFFFKTTFVEGLRILGFELVSRFRDDVNLRYLYTGEKTAKRERPKMFDGKVDLKNLRDTVFHKQTYDWDGNQVMVHDAVVYAVSLGRNIKVVIVDFENLDKKTQTRKVFYSTDC